MAIYYIGSVSVFSFFGVFSEFSPADAHIFGTMSFKIKPGYLNTCDLYLYNKYYTNIVNSDYVSANIVNTYIVTLVHYPSSNGREGDIYYIGSVFLPDNRPIPESCTVPFGTVPDRTTVRYRTVPYRIVKGDMTVPVG